ncbi:hypothetical protein PDE_04987 [Penicillium oxalicum 114-2]|uniref:Uncharacterized protein n=1 Tax=Penicillium oxalicum (strain 114-2 / CGMCC 5302) TaxID=933388 RepID=S8B5Y3_PENO1|nr:hypothetical protein PDE_04987 [Penicillium oxalicum 114-2]
MIAFDQTWKNTPGSTGPSRSVPVTQQNLDGNVWHLPARVPQGLRPRFRGTNMLEPARPTKFHPSERRGAYMVTACQRPWWEKRPVSSTVCWPSLDPSTKES